MRMIGKPFRAILMECELCWYRIKRMCGCGPKGSSDEELFGALKQAPAADTKEEPKKNVKQFM